MRQASAKEVILYKADWCFQSVQVENFLKEHKVLIVEIDIDGDPEARKKLMELNGGRASVPTLILPDGSMLTEPSISDLQSKLNLAQGSNLRNRIRRALAGGGRRSSEQGSGQR